MCTGLNWLEEVPSPNVHLIESVAAVFVLVLLNSILNGLVGVAAQVKLGTILHGAVTTTVLQIYFMQGVVVLLLFFFTIKQTL